MMKEKVSPLKDMPLRQPGESLDDQILDGALDGLLSYYLMATGMMVLTVFEWIGYLTEAPRQPFLVYYHFDTVRWILCL